MGEGSPGKSWRKRAGIIPDFLSFFFFFFFNLACRVLGCRGLTQNSRPFLCFFLVLLTGRTIWAYTLYCRLSDTTQSYIVLELVMTDMNAKLPTLAWPTSVDDQPHSCPSPPPTPKEMRN
ncbi:hypothetical protein LX36DRAFT_74226 [Colletotrichum falcatum]|nr:hypothetical protein LX36DRAFT_74226 [Colletotrichum falcatum]